MKKKLEGIIDLDLKTPVVVSGSSGFIGAALVTALKDFGFENVAGVDLLASPTTDFEADFGDETAIRKILPPGARIIHLGGVSTNGAAKEDPVAAVDANCLKAMAFAESCRQAGAEQFVFASSEWVYGDPDADHELSEESGLVPYLDNASLYAQTKLAAEGFLRTCGFFRNLTILRFAIVFGPRSNPSSAPESILSDCRANRPVRVGSSRSARRFIFIDDLVEGIIASIGFPGHETFNLAGPELVSLGRIYSVASNVAGYDPGLVENENSSPSIRNISGVKAKQLLGWAPRFKIEGCLRKI